MHQKVPVKRIQEENVISARHVLILKCRLSGKISQVKRKMSKRNLNPHNVLLQSDSYETCDGALKRESFGWMLKIMLQVYLCSDFFNVNFKKINKQGKTVQTLNLTHLTKIWFKSKCCLNNLLFVVNMQEFKLYLDIHSSSIFNLTCLDLKGRALCDLSVVSTRLLWWFMLTNQKLFPERQNRKKIRIISVTVDLIINQLSPMC